MLDYDAATLKKETSKKRKAAWGEADYANKLKFKAIQVIFFFVSMCVLWELNPQPFALLTQCSTTEPHEQEYKSYSRFLV